MISNWRSTFFRVKRALMRRGRSEHDADDLVQEAWVRLVDYSRGQAVVRPEAFLMQTALNLSKDAVRTARSQGEQLLLDESLVDDVLLVDSAPGVEAIVLAKERMARLSECLGELDERTRSIFIAHRINGQRQDEIAREHGITVSAVEKQVAKATLQLTIGMEGW